MDSRKTDSSILLQVTNKFYPVRCGKARRYSDRAERIRAKGESEEAKPDKEAFED